MKTETTKAMSMMDCKTAFATLETIIDVINPETGLTWIYGRDLANVQAEYPGAQLVNIDEWCKAKGERQNTPIEWTETTRDKYWEMLEVLPPAAMTRGAFLVGEAWDHHATTGRPRFACYRQQGDKYATANRPVSHAEFCAMFGKTSNDYLE